MLVAFAGLGVDFVALPQFEFVQIASELRARSVFLRDPTKRWYQNGLPGIDGGVLGVASHLRATIRASGVRRVVVVGNSAGGFAAILFGVLIDAQEVHAFVPKTRIRAPSDFLADESFHELARNIPADSPFLDMRALIERGAGAATDVYVHYGRGHAMDRRQALHLEGLPRVALVEYPWVNHGIARQLKKHGLLRPMIRCALEGRPRAVRMPAALAGFEMTGRTGWAAATRAATALLRVPTS